MKRRLFLVMLIGLFPCIVFAGHLYAAERTYNVLFIQSYNHRTPVSYTHLTLPTT